MRSNWGNGQYATGEDHYYAGPLKAWAKDGTLRGAVFCHGRTFAAAEAAASTSTGSRPLKDRVASAYPFLSADFAGATNWGAPTGVARVGDGVTYLQGTWGAKSGTVNLIGVSMGTLLALNYAKANPTKVGVIILVIPAVKMSDFTTTYATEITAAFGHTYVESTDGPGSNPDNYKASFTIPTYIYYSSDDPTAPPQSALDFAAGCPGVQAITSLGAVGHSETSIASVPLDDVMTILAAHA